MAPLSTWEWWSSDRKGYHQHTHSCSCGAPVHSRVSNEHPGSRQPWTESVLDLACNSQPSWYQSIYSPNWDKWFKLNYQKKPPHHWYSPSASCEYHLSLNTLFLQETRSSEKENDLHNHQHVQFFTFWNNIEGICF